jgi:hypothetical protein
VNQQTNTTSQTNTIKKPHHLTQASLCPEIFLMGGTHIVKQGRNALFYKKPTPVDWSTVTDFLHRLEKDILKGWAQTASDILARVQYEDIEVCTTADLLMDTTLITIYPGSSALEMRRLETLIEIFFTTHLIRKLGHKVETAALFQPLSGLWIEMDLRTWNGSELDAFLRAKIS